jgi:FKBP-type peptidyl-prolyl cis-trans isomerase FkpA
MSAVTAVPLRPIARGSVLKLWIGLALLSLVALGVAWWGTRWMQPVTLDSGVRVQTIREGTGPMMTDADVIALRFQVHVNSIDAPPIGDSGPEPLGSTVQDAPPGLAIAVQAMRAGGRYVVRVPARVAMGNRPLPPTARFTANDILVFDVQALQIEAGAASAFQMQRMQQMMQRQQMQQSGAMPPGAGGAPQGAPPSPAGR